MELAHPQHRGKLTTMQVSHTRSSNFANYNQVQHTLGMFTFPTKQLNKNISNLLQYVGAIIAAWTVFGTVKYTSDAAWRIPVGMQAAMPVIQFALILCLPESPRWLLSKDRPDEALAVLVKVCESFRAFRSELT